MMLMVLMLAAAAWLPAHGVLAAWASAQRQEPLVIRRRRPKLARPGCQKGRKQSRRAEEVGAAPRMRVISPRRPQGASMQRRKVVSGRQCGDFLSCLLSAPRPNVRRPRPYRAWMSRHRVGNPGAMAINMRLACSWCAPERALYLVMGDGKARRYKVGVGREGFQWSGNSRIVNKAEWPTWRPPQVMIDREAAKGHFLPTEMEGGPENPLGARALYIGGTMFRIHGTNNAASIGGAVSSGCIRMMNTDVIDLYDRVKVGAKVYVYQ
jgi:hypothetical protein